MDVMISMCVQCFGEGSDEPIRHWPVAGKAKPKRVRWPSSVARWLHTAGAVPRPCLRFPKRARVTRFTLRLSPDPNKPHAPVYAPTYRPYIPAYYQSSLVVAGRTRLARAAEPEALHNSIYPYMHKCSARLLSHPDSLDGRPEHSEHCAARRPVELTFLGPTTTNEQPAVPAVPDCLARTERPPPLALLPSHLLHILDPPSMRVVQPPIFNNNPGSLARRA